MTNIDKGTPHMDTEYFWLVWRDQGPQPMKKHDLERYAIDEAERLAAQYPGQFFYVLKATHRSVVREPVTTVTLDKAPIPF